MIKGKVRKIVTMLLFITMTFNSVTALAESKYSLPVSSLKEDLHSQSMNKIEAGFIDNSSDEELVEAIIYLNSQVDSMGVAKEAEGKLSSALTPYNTKLEVRKEVIGALKDNAEDTQQKLLKYITQEEKKNAVVEYKPYYIINAVYVKATKKVIENISYMSEVEKIYENKIVKLDEPKVTAGEIQANADGVEWNIERIRADEVWGLGVDGTGVVVGTIDTGATWTHPALKLKWRGYNPNDPANPTSAGNWYDPVNGSTLPVDEASIPHGTHVLGTILGQEPNGSNKIGAAPGATWITAKAFTAEGGYDDAILSAAEWMLAPGGNPAAAPDIINNSWGGASGLDEWFRPMVTAWRAAGILPVFSAGNERNAPAPPASVSAPANYPESFAVGALDINNVRGDFSRRGPGPYSNIKPDVIAPGVNIRSSVPSGYEGGWDGTSMSAPAVSGTAALILSANSSLSVDEVEDLLIDTAIPIEDANDAGDPNYGYGYGLIDAFEAVSRIAGGTGTIEGKVSVEGEDLENPVINHNQLITETYSGAGIQVDAQISDDVSIIDTELLVKQSGKAYWITLPLKRSSGDYKSGVYTGTIPSDLITQPGFVYKIKARDYDGNTVATVEYKVEVKFGAVPDSYSTDFENYPSGWILDGDWQWGEPATGVGPTPLSGTKLIGTNLKGNYSSSGDSLLISVPLDLRDTTLRFAQFEVNQWYDIENNYDKGFVYVTNDLGETWNQVGPVITGNKTSWRTLTINLNEYIGSTVPVYIAFRLVSDASVSKVGWYLDGAKFVATDNTAPSVPANLTANIILNSAVLNWSASAELDTAGYRIYRSDSIDGEYELLAEAATNSYGDSSIEAHKTYYYKVSAFDFAGNESEQSPPLTLQVQSLSDYVYYSDFENDNGGYLTGGTNNSWQWGVPTSGPGTGINGAKVWATGLAANYSNSSNSWLETTEIQLPEDKISTLTVGQWYEIENKYDKGYIQIAKKDGDNWSAWTDLAPGGFYTGDGKTWANTTFVLNSSFKGKTVKVRFLLTSDASVNKAGWYIDYVMVSAANAAASSIKLPDYTKKVNDLSIQKKEIEVKPLKRNLKEKETTVTKKYKTVSDAEVKALVPVTAGLPADAVVTVLETGRSAKTNPADGRFTLKHPVNEGETTWTLRAEAYGYYTAEAQVHLTEDQTVKKNFALTEKPKGIIKGKVTDRYSGEPAANAVIRVKEDSKIPVITADSNGEFAIPNIYEGTYTLKVIADGFEPGEISATVTGNKTTEVTIPLKRFVGYEEEIVYDDGTGENALVLNAVGNGLAIRVTPTHYGKVKGANIFFWGTDWPSPGGNQIGITIYDTDKNGNPVKLNVSPKVVKVVRGAWNYIDLSEFGFSTNRDFFIATSQTGIGTASPGTGIDESSLYADRSYLYSGDTFTPIAEEEVNGGLMIRARMEYSVDTPIITNLKEINYTNQDTILVEGTVTADGKVNLFVNGVKTEEVTTVNKSFSKVVALTSDESFITATSELNGKETEPSPGKTVIKDKVAPELIITSPTDGFVTNERVVDITGTVSDHNFSRLEINNEIVAVHEGTFQVEKIVYAGENTFTLKAYDFVGNVTVKQLRVTVKKDAPIISGLEPANDVNLTPGQSLTVSFHSEPGGRGTFKVVLPTSVSTQSNNGVAMQEVSEGYYVGTWMAPQANISGLVVEAEFVDSAGNKVTATATGKINIVKEQGISDLTPSANVSLKSGEVLTVSFKSLAGGTASFRIIAQDQNAIKPKTFTMREVSSGYYTGTWIAPNYTKASGLVIEVTYTDIYGNTLTATAAGTIDLVLPNSGGLLLPEAPVLPESPEKPIYPVPVDPSVEY